MRKIKLLNYLAFVMRPLPSSLLYAVAKLYSYFAQKIFLNKLRVITQENPIKVIFDIGANQGNWSRYYRKRFPDSEFFLFEADNECAEKLKGDFVNVHHCVLSNSEKDVNWYGKPSSTGSSIYKEVSSNFQFVKPVTRSAVTLDAISKKWSIPLPDLIKIDTQGSELDILSGGVETIAQTRFLIVEVPIAAYNEGAPSFVDYVTQISNFGFCVTSLLEIHTCPDSGRLLQIDLVFENRSSLVATEQ